MSALTVIEAEPLEIVSLPRGRVNLDLHSLAQLRNLREAIFATLRSAGFPVRNTLGRAILETGRDPDLMAACAECGARGYTWSKMPMLPDTVIFEWS